MISERIFRARRSARMTVEQAAAESGVEADQFRKYEDGTEVPGHEVLKRIGEAFKLKVSYFHRPGGNL